MDRSSTLVGSWLLNFLWLYMWKNCLLQSRWTRGFKHAVRPLPATGSPFNGRCFLSAAERRMISFSRRPLRREVSTDWEVLSLPQWLLQKRWKNHTQPLAGGFYASLVEVGDGESSLRVRASTTVANGSPSMKSRVENTRKKFNQMIHLEVCLELTSHQLRE